MVGRRCRRGPGRCPAVYLLSWMHGTEVAGLLINHVADTGTRVPVCNLRE